MPAESVDPAAAVRELLRDHFGRIRELVQETCAGLSEAVGTYRPDPDANTVDWLVWHVARVQDDHIADLAGVEQVWTADGWYRRFGLPFEPAAHGYGQTSEEVAAVVVTGDLLDGYQAAVHRATLSYLDGITVEELARIVDTRWDPPVTAAVRIVSVIGDCLQHLGQAAYVRGLAERA
jgi:DNA-directed RNA polymerase specialized sigma24 family protein